MLEMEAEQFTQPSSLFDGIALEIENGMKTLGAPPL
jgi:hypothetical protein